MLSSTDSTTCSIFFTVCCMEAVFRCLSDLRPRLLSRNIHSCPLRAHRKQGPPSFFTSHFILRRWQLVQARAPRVDFCFVGTVSLAAFVGRTSETATSAGRLWEVGLMPPSYIESSKGPDCDVPSSSALESCRSSGTLKLTPSTPSCGSKIIVFYNVDTQTLTRRHQCTA